jgi:hypothetical protein
MLGDCGGHREIERERGGVGALGFQCDSARSFIARDEVSSGISLPTTARMRWGWRCSYRARITLSLLPVDARRIRTSACRSTVVEVDRHQQRGDVASPALCYRPRRGGRRRLSSSGTWAPPISHIPKRYVAWAGCWAALVGFGLVSSPLYFFSVLLFFSIFPVLLIWILI